MRLIPATPMADSRPPIVVGIRQTSSATSTVMVTTLPLPLPAASTLYCENGNRVAVARTNTMVSATSRIVSAISFGVLRRLAPSTMAIMRSRKVSPGLTLHCTTSQSDSTRVPPVTEEKSPPDSRITGADSPVMALSSTEAPPSSTSPSHGMVSPASTSTISPLRRLSAATFSVAPSRRGPASFFAQLVFLVPFRLSAWALLRPSASASAKLANSTVNHSHRATLPVKAAAPSVWPVRIASQMAVVRMLPIYTTNITGLRH